MYRDRSDGKQFQSTLPTRGSDAWIPEDNMRERVSIHAPHEGERPAISIDSAAASGVSIHAPHEGERLAGVGLTSTSDGFQSTLPTRGSDGELIPCAR